MDTKVKLLVACHTIPEVINLTLGTWLESYDGSYDADITISIHENYRDYCEREDEILSLPNVKVLRVPEINYYQHGLMRYSIQHATVLTHLLESCRGAEFTHVAMLDHDLVFQDDFISWAIRGFPDSDWTLSLFDDKPDPREVVATTGGKLVFAPKPSVWNMVFSRHVYDCIMGDTKVIVPECVGNFQYDTFAKAYEHALCDWGVSVNVLPEADIQQHVNHLWSSSFNYGFFHARYTTRTDEDARDKYRRKMDSLIAMYQSRFPNGIGHLLEKLNGSSHSKDIHSPYQGSAGNLPCRD